MGLFLNFSPSPSDVGRTPRPSSQLHMNDCTYLLYVSKTSFIIYDLWILWYPDFKKIINIYFFFFLIHGVKMWKKTSLLIRKWSIKNVMSWSGQSSKKTKLKSRSQNWLYRISDNIINYHIINYRSVNYPTINYHRPQLQLSHHQLFSTHCIKYFHHPIIFLLKFLAPDQFPLKGWEMPLLSQDHSSGVGGIVSITTLVCSSVVEVLEGELELTINNRFEYQLPWRSG